MKKAILISIQPQWVEKILNGEKTIEIRKSMPKCELPIDVYIYCTKGGPYLRVYPFNIDKNICQLTDDNFNSLNGKIVAKFTLNKVNNVIPYFKSKSNGKTYVQYISDCEDVNWGNQTCLEQLDFENYLGSKSGYAWHIENLEVFDKPMKLSEFYRKRNCHFLTMKCFDCPYYYQSWGDKGYIESCNYPVYKIIQRPPQSWQYVYVEV